jgi:hypothetical protein
LSNLNDGRRCAKVERKIRMVKRRAKGKFKKCVKKLKHV